MTVLTIRAYGDFDAPCDINIAVGEEQKIQGICRVLNGFCKELPGRERDVKLSYYLDQDDVANELLCQLIDKGHMSTQKATDFIEKLKDVCRHSYVCVGEYIFGYESLFNI